METLGDLCGIVSGLFLNFLEGRIGVPAANPPFDLKLKKLIFELTAIAFEVRVCNEKITIRLHLYLLSITREKHQSALYIIT